MVYTKGSENETGIVSRGFCFYKRLGAVLRHKKHVNAEAGSVESIAKASQSNCSPSTDEP